MEKENNHHGKIFHNNFTEFIKESVNIVERNEQQNTVNAIKKSCSPTPSVKEFEI